MRRTPGSYTPDLSAMPQARNPEAYPHDQKLAPQARVVREFNLGSDAVYEWNDYINSLGRRNDGNARVRAPGNLRFTFIDTAQMGRMFKYRFNSSNPDKLLREMRTVSRDYNDFAKKEGDKTLDRQLELSGRLKDENFHWLNGDFEIDDMLVPPENSRTRRALVFSSMSRTILRNEVSETISWFKSEGFDTRNLGRGKPHLTIAETFHPIGTVAFNQSEYVTPLYVPLDEPVMRVFTNHPSA
jgi:hypothetical protein